MNDHYGIKNSSAFEELCHGQATICSQPNRHKLLDYADNLVINVCPSKSSIVAITKSIMLRGLNIWDLKYTPN